RKGAKSRTQGRNLRSTGTKSKGVARSDEQAALVKKLKRTLAIWKRSSKHALASWARRVITLPSHWSSSPRPRSSCRSFPARPASWSLSSAPCWQTPRGYARPSSARSTSARARDSTQVRDYVPAKCEVAHTSLPIRPSKVRHDNIYLAPGGDTWHQNQ